MAEVILRAVKREFHENSGAMLIAVGIKRDDGLPEDLRQMLAPEASDYPEWPMWRAHYDEDGLYNIWFNNWLEQWADRSCK